MIVLLVKFVCVALESGHDNMLISLFISKDFCRISEMCLPIPLSQLICRKDIYE